MTHLWDHRKIGEILTSLGFIDAGRLSAALKSDITPVGQALLSAKAINPEQLAQALARQANVEFVTLDDYSEADGLFDILTIKQCNQMNVVPLKEERGSLFVAVADPFDLELTERLERISGMRIRHMVASSEAIASTLAGISGTQTALKGVSDKLLLNEGAASGRQKAAALDEGADEASPVIELVNRLLLTAIRKSASDIHIEAGSAGVSVRYRIDGVLLPALEPFDLAHHSSVVTRLKVMSDLDITEKRIPQDGRFNLSVRNREIDFRVSILPSGFGEDVVIRILDRMSVSNEVLNMKLDDLGFDRDALGRFRKGVEAPHGMILISGPTGSGKTTTLYTALNELNLKERKVITIEDPVEYQLDGVVQVPVNEKKGLTFSRGLRSILRHDPDVVMVGEIRDAETAEIAVQAALTGHLLFSTVHANSAMDVIPRFHHMGIDVYDLVSVLHSVSAQRLIRKLCNECRRQAAPEASHALLSTAEVARYGDAAWHVGEGCKACDGSGYSGRIAIAEIMAMTPALREMIVARAPMQKIFETAVDEGMKTLRQDALEKAAKGLTSLAEVNRVTYAG